MKRALALARKGAGQTSPNPMVGAVVVKNGRIIAEGYHERAGKPHAEAVALERAGKQAKGAELYVNLEPCCHTKKRTPPCVGAIIAAGVRKVVAAMTDPNPSVSGKGLEALRAAGVEVASGLLERQARALNEAYIKFIRTGLPFVTLKAAMTLDGRIATSTCESKWITGPEARRLVHKLRMEVDAVLTAVGTVKADDPQLTCRLDPADLEEAGNQMARDPVRVVIDPDLESPPGSRIFRTPPQTILITRKPAPQWAKNSGVKFLKAGQKEIPLPWLMTELGHMGITSVLIEGGSSLNARAIEQGVVDKVTLFYAPSIMGGMQSVPAFGGRGAASLADMARIKSVSIKKAGKDILLTGYVDLQKKD